MFRTILKLPDGREISSGAGQQYVIRSFKLTERVNDSKELTLVPSAPMCWKQSSNPPTGVWSCWRVRR